LLCGVCGGRGEEKTRRREDEEKVKEGGATV
jgi:hypothetical protein